MANHKVDLADGLDDFLAHALDRRQVGCELFLTFDAPFEAKRDDSRFWLCCHGLCPLSNFCG
jgi:hypothetical protein